jgi:hypothetical protein
MSYFVSLGEDIPAAPTAPVAPVFDLAAMLKTQGAALERLELISEEGLLFRKIATVAAIVGAAMALLKLADIYMAVQERKERRIGVA